MTVFDLAARIRRLSGSDSEIIFRPLHYTDVEMRIPNVDKARSQLGWEPRVDLDDGLARTIAWYREFLRTRFFGTRPVGPPQRAAA